MVQFYFLTIVFLVIGSLILLVDEYGEKYPAIMKLQNFVFHTQTNTIILLVLTAVTGISKLISPISPGPVVLGDLFPAVALITVAIFYGFEIKSLGDDTPKEEDDLVDDNAFIDSEIVDKAEGFFYKNKKVLGYIILGVACFHFLFPSAVLL